MGKNLVVIRWKISSLYDVYNIKNEVISRKDVGVEKNVFEEYFIFKCFYLRFDNYFYDWTLLYTRTLTIFSKNNYCWIIIMITII